MKEQSVMVSGADILCPVATRAGVFLKAGLPTEENILSQLQSGHSLYEVAQGMLSTFRTADTKGVLRQRQMVQIRQQQVRQEDRYVAKFLDSKASEIDGSTSTPLVFPLLSEPQELFVVADIDLAKWILSDAKTFDRARTLESFANAFHLNSVFTTKDPNLYGDLKRFFVRKTNGLPPEEYKTMQDSLQSHVDFMLTKFDDNSEVPFISKVEGMVLGAYADVFFGMKKFPDAEECAALIKSVWQIKSLQNNIPSQNTDQSLSIKMEQLQKRMFSIIENAQSIIDKSGSKTAGEMAQIYRSNGYEPGNLLNAFIPLYEAIGRGLVYAFVELGHTPSLQEQLYAELAQNANDELQYCKSTNTLLQRTWQEALRLRPPTPNQTRRVTTEDHALFPYDSKVAIVWSLFHQDPQVWGEDAGQFNPNRWLNVTRAQEQNYNPFGSGVQKCVAMNYASFGGRVMLKRIVESVRIHPRNDSLELGSDQGYSRGPDPDRSVLRFESR